MPSVLESSCQQNFVQHGSREVLCVLEAQSAPRLTDHDDACEDGPRTPSFVLRMSSVFAIEATVGDVIIRLSTGNNESFTLKRSAKEFHVDFSCFTGTLCITSSSNDDNSYFESYSTPPLSEELLMNSNTTECSLPERALPKDAVESEGHDEGSAKSDGEDIHGILKGESSETKGPTIESFTKKTRFHESVNESEAFQSCKEALPIRESAVRSYRETFHEGSIRSVDSRRNLCVQLKDRIDQYESFRDFISSTVASTPSDLQIACAIPKVASELQVILDSDPQAASAADSEGRYPLHILSENEALLSRFVGRTDALDFCLNLFEAFPEAIIIRDNTGAFPFVHLIQNWVTDAYTFGCEENVKPRQGLIRKLRSGGKLTSLFGSESDEDEIIRKEATSRRNRFPQVILTREARMSFEVLSSFLDRLNESYQQGSFDRDANMLVRAVLARSIADIPNLLKTVFLIDDTDKRHWVSSCSIIKRVFFCSESTGDWVANMIQRGSVPSRRAVDYLVEVSTLTAADFIGPGRSPRTYDIKAYRRDRSKVFETLENSAPMITSLAVLSNEERGRAATTDAVWLILNHCLSNPLVVGLLLADFVFSITLLQTFRFVSNTETNAYYFGREGSPIRSHQAITLFLSVCLYFGLRKLSEFYSLLKLSGRAFRGFAFDFWNLIDVAAIVLSLTSVLTQTDNPDFLALAMAFLWMKLLGLLRAINAHLATFILAILEVSTFDSTRCTRYFRLD